MPTYAYEAVTAQFAQNFEVVKKNENLATYPGREGCEYLLVLRKR